jgi:hypothetical protein
VVDIIVATTSNRGVSTIRSPFTSHGNVEVAKH